MNQTVGASSILLFTHTGPGTAVDFAHYRQTAKTHRDKVNMVKLDSYTEKR